MNTTTTLYSPSVQRVGHSEGAFYVELATGSVYMYDCPTPLASELHNTVMSVSVSNQDTDTHDVYDVVQKIQREFPEPTQLSEWPDLTHNENLPTPNHSGQSAHDSLPTSQTRSLTPRH